MMAARISALFIALTLFLPDPAFALRGAGLEENSAKKEFMAGLGEREKFPLLSRDEAFTQLNQLAVAFKRDRQTNGGFQDGKLLDLREVPSSVEIIFIGDVHERWDRVEAILAYRPDGGKSNEEKIAAGEAICLLLGDLVHDGVRLGRGDTDMRASAYAVQSFMRRKIQYPHGIQMIEGNHDHPLYGAAFLNPATKTMINIGEIYRNLLGERYGPAYLRVYDRSFSGNMPLLAIGNGFVAAHAGPAISLKGRGLDQKLALLRYEGWNDMEADSRNGLLDGLIRSRPQPGGTPLRVPVYMENQAKQFLADLEQPPESLFVVGHTHPGRGAWFFYPFKEWQNFVVLYAGNRTATTGYGRYLNGKFELIEIPRAAGGLEEPIGPVKYTDFSSTLLGVIQGVAQEHAEATAFILHLIHHDPSASVVEKGTAIRIEKDRITLSTWPHKNIYEKLRNIGVWNSYQEWSITKVKVEPPETTSRGSVIYSVTVNFRAATPDLPTPSGNGVGKPPHSGLEEDRLVPVRARLLQAMWEQKPPLTRNGLARKIGFYQPPIYDFFDPGKKKDLNLSTVYEMLDVLNLPPEEIGIVGASLDDARKYVRRATTQMAGLDQKRLAKRAKIGQSLISLFLAGRTRKGKGKNIRLLSMLKIVQAVKEYEREQKGLRIIDNVRGTDGASLNGTDRRLGLSLEQEWDGEQSGRSL